MTKSRLVNDLKARFMRRFRREDGQIIVMVGLATIVLFAAVGLAVDVGRMYIMKAELSRAMDAAALAGVLEIDGTAAGITRAQAVCEEYLLDNEPDIVPIGGTEFCTSPGENQLLVRGTKNMTMFFVRVLGINNAEVSGKARAGFGVASLDTALVLDVTASMVGDPITNAKAAAISFKNQMLGSGTPDGRTLIGMTAFRGCYRPSPAPAGAGTNCIDTTTQYQALTSNSATLTTKINALTAGGGQAGTNVCTGLAKGWDILNGPGNHAGETNARRYLVLLSDGDNYYPGNNTYQGPLGVSAPSSPDGTTVAGTGYPCQPYDSCASPWNISPATPCHIGIYTALATAASDNFGSTGAGTSITESFPSSGCTTYNWNGSGNWSGSWTRSPASGTYLPVTLTGSTPQDTSCHTRLLGQATIARQFSLATAATATLSYYTKRGGTWEVGDTGVVEIATALAGPYTSLGSHSSSLGTSYTQFSVNLDAYAGQSTLFLRFRANLNANIDATEFFYVDHITISSTTSCPAWNNTTSGTWASNWALSPVSGNDMPTVVTTSSPNDTTCHAQIRGVGTITRTLNLSTAGEANLVYYGKKANWESGDQFIVEASSNGTSWTTLRTFVNSGASGSQTNASTSYTTYTDDLDAFAGSATVYIRFRGVMTANDTTDQFYIDTVSVTTGGSSADGYLNGADGSNPSTCNENGVPRERQLDVRTYNLARAMKAEGVEIFVVAFTAPTIPGCNLGSGTLYNDGDPSECNTVLDSPSGPIGGSPVTDNSANVRLLKCIASSPDESDNHYYYAASAADLPGIFTQIAKQIAHRLIE